MKAKIAYVYKFDESVPALKKDNRFTVFEERGAVLSVYVKTLYAEAEREAIGEVIEDVGHWVLAEHFELAFQEAMNQLALIALGEPLLPAFAQLHVSSMLQRYCFIHPWFADELLRNKLEDMGIQYHLLVPEMEDVQA